MSVTFTLIIRELQGLFWSMKGAVGLFVMEVPESTQVARETEGPIQVGQLLPEWGWERVSPACLGQRQQASKPWVGTKPDLGSGKGMNFWEQVSDGGDVKAEL